MQSPTDKAPAPSDPLSEGQTVRENWDRYEYGRDRGHDAYCIKARRLEDFYLGGGSQWDEADKQALREQRRMPIEFNEILPGVNAAIGYQIANRMDITFEPRAGMANQATADALNKVALQISDNTKLHWQETQVFSDGLIQQRGYYDVRIDFADSMRGELSISTLDPMDVIPDPDAKSYDPDGWGDVIKTGWLTPDEIGRIYGDAAKGKAMLDMGSGTGTGDPDFGDEEVKGTERAKFGDLENSQIGSRDAVRGDASTRRLRVIDRQQFIWQMCQVAVTPDTGDVRVVEGMEPAKLQAVLAQGAILTRRMSKRVRWTVTTFNAVLHDDFSPYPWFTVVPFFCYFRRGRTRSMVDNAIGPQEALNKAGSQFIHILNTAAKGGWKVEEGSLTQMSLEKFKEDAARPGFVVEYRSGSRPPEEIVSAQIPAGIDRLMDRLTMMLKNQTTPEALRGVDEDPSSGIDRQTKQFAAQQQLAVVLDNLGRTRHLLADRLVWGIQNYYDEPRVYRIAKKDPATGENMSEDLHINAPDPATGQLLNDLTLGEYGVIVNERPQQITFENGQFEQAVKMREIGVSIPDDVVVKNSGLADKEELMKRMAQQPAKTDPTVQAKVALMQAQTEKTKNEAVAKSVEAQFSAINTAQVIASVPATAPLADALLKSSGYIDQDGGSIVPEPPPGIATLDMPSNTNPNTPLNPTNPDVGLNTGIEAGL